MNIQVVQLDLLRASIHHLDGEEKRLQELKSFLQQKAKFLDKRKPSVAERQKSNLDGQKSTLSRTKSNLSRTKSNLRSSLVRKKSSVNGIKTKSTATKEVSEDAMLNNELKEVQSELKKSKRLLEQQLKEGERDLAYKEKELSVKELELNTSVDYKIQTYMDLTTKLKGVIENLKKDHAEKEADLMKSHDKEINEFLQVGSICLATWFMYNVVRKMSVTLSTQERLTGKWRVYLCGQNRLINLHKKG